MTGSPTLPGPGRLAKLPFQVLARDVARRRDFSRIDPLDLGDLPALAHSSCTTADTSPVDERLSLLLRRPEVLTFASGVQALRHTLGALLGPKDDIIIDAGAQPAMFEPVLRSGARFHRCPPGSTEAVERRLSRLPRRPRMGRVFVLVPAVARLTSNVADLGELSRLCAAYGAILVVDITQDLGTIGPEGRGIAEVQGCELGIDVLLADLSVTCGVAGGMAAFRDPTLGNRVLRSGPIPSPAPEAITRIVGVLDLIASPEGRRRRRLLHGASLRLRNHLMADAVPVMGQPSPIVPLRLPRELARDLTAMVASAGLKLPLVTAPEVAGRAPRWLIHLTAGHTPADIDDLAIVLRDVIRAGARQRLLSVP